MKWYCYRRKRDGMEIRRAWWSPWLWFKGYRLMEVIDTRATRDVKG